MSCINLDKDYIDKYIKNRNKAFLSYFNKYPLIMDEFLLVIGKDISSEHDIILCNVVNNTCHENGMWTQTDEETYKVLNGFYSLLIPEI